jgi:hypothetical protein
MKVKVIRPSEVFRYSLKTKKVRVEFKDGSHMLGFVNIHAKYIGNDLQDDSNRYMPIDDSKYLFSRTSDFLRDCNQHEGMITVFNAVYGDREHKVCFVFLHSVKFISEDIEMEPEPEEAEPQKAEPQEEEKFPMKTNLKLRERIKRND